MQSGPSPEVPWWGWRSASELVIIVAGYASNRQVTEWALPDGQLMINDGGGWKEVKNHGTPHKRHVCAVPGA
jgi:hypothetical protein